VVELRLLRAPVVLRVPVPGELLQAAQRYAAAPPHAGQLAGPPGAGEPAAQVVNVGLGDLDAEGLDAVAHALATPSRGPQVDPDVLTVIASACRDHERLRFDYQAHSGAASRRSVEPYRLVNDQRRWYLVAWDTGRDGWRTFRADRIKPRTPSGPRFAPRALPPDREIAAQVARGIGEATWRYRARVIVHAPAAYVRGRLPIPAAVESLNDDQCAFEPGSGHPEMLALYLGMLDADFTIVDSPELVDALRKLTRRYQRAIDSSQQTSG